MEQVFLEASIKRFKEYKTLGDRSFEQIADEGFLFAPNEVSNSIAVIIQHMHGNMLSRWTNFLTEDGEKTWRKRDAEFENQAIGRAELLRLWEEGWKVLFDALESLNPGHLTNTVTIRSQPLTVTDAIVRQMAHYSYHVGQIVYLARWFKGQDWKSLSIPRGNSDQYNSELKQSRH